MTKPVTSGAMTPPMLPAQFMMPTQRATSSSRAQNLGIEMRLPQPMPASDAPSRNATDAADDSASAAGMIRSPIANPAVTNDFVTTENDAPRRTRRPAIQPPVPSAVPKMRKGSAPNSAIFGIDMWRTVLR